MESIKREELLKNRGLGATLKAAYGMFLSRFQYVLKHLWPAALLFALFGSLIVSIPFTTQGRPSMWLFIPIMLLAIVASVVLYSRIAQLLNDKSWKWNVGRMIKLVLVDIGINLVVCVVIGVVWLLAWLLFAPQESSTPVEAQLSMEQLAAASLKILAVVGIVSVVIALLLVPFAFSYTKYLVDTESRLRLVFGSSYKQGLRHWGRIFIVMLVVGIVTYACILLTELPALILYLANTQSQIGRLQGDPVGMPDYMLWMNIVVFAIAGFIQAYIFLSTLYPAYYLYGSIETEEKERQTLTPNTQQP